MQREYDYLFKLVLAGDSAVGKSSLVKRFADDEFDEAQIPTIGVDFKIKTIELSNRVVVKLQVWDTAGQERFQALTPMYYRGGEGFVVVYDVTNRVSFQKVRKLFHDIEQHAVREGTCKVLVGNKADRSAQRVVSTEEGHAFADSLGVDFFETSAKESRNVQETFVHLASQIMAKRMERMDYPPDDHQNKESFKLRRTEGVFELNGTRSKGCSC